MVTAPATASGAEGALITFTVTASDPDGDAITSLTATGLPAGATFTTNASHTSGTFSWASSFAQPPFTVTFTASNALSGSASTVITIGQFGIRAPVVTAPASASGNIGTLITFTVSASDPDGDAITNLTAAPLPAGATFTKNAANTSGTFSWTPSFTQEGTYNVTFTATNALSGSATTNITVTDFDRAPIVVAPATASGAENALLTFTVTASDPDGEAITSLTATGLPTGATFTKNVANTSGTFSWTPSFAQAGTYSVTFTAVSGFPALSGTRTTQITVLTSDPAPVVTAPFTVTGLPGSLITFTVTVASPDGAAITSLTASGSAMTAGGVFTTNASRTSGTFSWTPGTSQTGTFSATFTAVNSISIAGSRTTTINVVADRAPVVTAPAVAQAIIGVPMSFTVSAADPDGDAITSLTASGTAMSAGATFTSNATNTSGTFAWTAGFTQAGTYSAIFTATNALSGSATTAITVCACDRAPVVTAPATASGAENTLITFTVTAADPDGDALTNLVALGLPLEASFTRNAASTSGTFSWTPSFTQAGTYSVTFRASNALSGSATTTITIINTDRAPVVTAPSSVSGPTNVLLTFTVPAVDPDGEPITSLTAAGSAITAGGSFATNATNTSGTFTWTPSPDQEGSYSVTFTAFSGNPALSGTATTQITVGDAALAARAFTSASNKTIRLNSGKPRWCAFLESMEGSFDIMNIEIASVRLRSLGTGTVSEIPAGMSKAMVVGDADKNDVSDIELCFAKEDLRALFSDLNGRNTVTVSITGTLAPPITGRTFETTVSVDVIASGGGLAASIAPNPLGLSGMISFQTRASGPARIRLFDASGRVVRTVDAPSLSAGVQRLSLQGRDEAGRRLPSGVYFYRVDAGGEFATGRFTVLK